MQPSFRSIAIVGLGFSLLLVQSMLGSVLTIHPFSPHLLLPIVLYVGVAPDVPLVRGAFVSFLLGYLLDLFSGNLMSLQTFICVATFVLARGAGLRLLLRGPGFQIALTFVVAVLAGGTTVALRAIFSLPAPFPAGGAADTALMLLAPATSAALLSPIVFTLVQRIDQNLGRKREESPA